MDAPMLPTQASAVHGCRSPSTAQIGGRLRPTSSVDGGRQPMQTVAEPWTLDESHQWCDEPALMAYAPPAQREGLTQPDYALLGQ